MGRNRKRKFQKLPKYVYWAKGRFVFIDRIDGVRQKEVVIGKDDMSMPDVWEAWRQLTGKSIHTLQYLVDEYRKSDKFNNLKSSRAVGAALDRLLATPTNTGTFGQVKYADITPHLIQRYLDKRNCVAGNREVAYLSSAWRWCRSRGVINQENPCTSLDKKKEQHRTKYVTDAEYKAMYDAMPKYGQVAMELAYLCRMRTAEVLDCRVKDIEQDGLNTRRVKGSNDALTLWTPRLRSVVDMGLEGCMRVPEMPIVNNGKGAQVTYHALRSAWVRAKNKTGLDFTFHDLKAKGVSDFDGDKKSASGHKSERMVDVYDRKRKEVESTT